MLPITDTNFEHDVLHSHRPTLLTFHAPWNQASQLAVRLVADVSNNFGDLVTVAGIDVDENPMTPCQYAIEALPMFLLFRDGRVIKKLGPAFDRSELQSLFELGLAVD